jgi:hypothetical protein
MAATKATTDAMAQLDGFTPDGFYNETPYRFGNDGSIDAFVGGTVVHFDGIVSFATPLRRRNHFWLNLSLLTLHVAILCASFYYVQQYYSYIQFIAFNNVLLPKAALCVALFSTALLPLFLISRFSFGYYLGFYFFNVILGYAWLVEFSTFSYSFKLALISILLSAIAFLVPSLFLTCKLPKSPQMSEATFDKLLTIVLLWSATILGISSVYNFKIVGIAGIYDFRNQIEFPLFLRYAIGMTANSLLPFAFASFVFRRRWLSAVSALLFLLLFFPVTLTKVTLFAPFWLLFLLVLSKLFEPRRAVVLSVLLPVSAGVVSVLLTEAGFLSYPPINLLFGTVNFRLIAVPSLALDVYNDFFSHHAHTHFCQVIFLKNLMSCPYSQPLTNVMQQSYGLGSFNASLFATEGIASVGPIAAPLSALVCGLVICIANGMASGLPPKFILLSSGIILQCFLNVPFTTTLLTNGAGLLFLLWYLTPRSMFGEIEK